MTSKRHINEHDSDEVEEDYIPKKRVKVRKKRKTKKEKISSLNNDSYVFSPFNVQEYNEDGGEIGLIKQVTLKNFMCHANLEFIFGPRVNFVIGRNGSGKTAVSNGIILALGGSAHNTNKYRNVKGFITTGKQLAYIAVTLKNTGSDAYRPEVYGSSIIVERKLIANGTGSYQLKSSSGRLISSRKEELNNILEALNIQVDNPVSVLTQEASKTFLSIEDSKDKSKDKYTFFYKATQLEKLWLHYSEAAEKSKITESRLEIKLKTLPDLQKEVKRWEDKVKHILMLEEKESEIKQLENEYLWAQVVCLEKIEVQKSELKKKISEAKQELSNRLNDCEEKCASHKEEMEHWISSKNTINESIEAVNVKIEETKASLNKLRKQFVITKNKQNQLEREEKTKNEEIKSLEKCIQDFKSRNENTEEKKLSIKLLEKGIAALEVQVGQTKSNLMQLKQEITDEEKKYNDTRHEFENLMFELKNIAKNLERLRSQENAFGNKMLNLLKKIDLANKKGYFRCLPKGPIGMYLKVRDSKWTFAVEICLKKKLLYGFCCDNFFDARHLEKLMDEVYGPHDYRPCCFVSSFQNQVYDVSQHKVFHPDEKSVFDIIKCSDPDIMNCLIDQVKIERILLVEDPEKARDLMCNPPVNCNILYTKSGDQIYPAPKSRYYSCKEKASQYSLLRSCDIEEDIRNKEAILSMCQKSSVEKSKILEDIKHEKERKSDDFKSMTDTLERILKNIDNKRHQLNEWKILYNSKPLQDMEDELVKHQEDKKILHDKKVELEAELADITAGIESFNVHYNIHLSQKKENEELLSNKILANIRKLQEEEISLRSKKEHYQKQHENVVKMFEEANRVLKSAEEDVAAKTAEVLSICNNVRIDTQRSPEEIEKLITEIRKEKADQLSKYNKDEVNRNYIVKKKKYDLLKKEIDSLTRSNENLKKRIKTRRKKFEDIRRSISLQVRHLFVVNLKNKGFVGDLTFDHKNSKLNITAYSGTKKHESGTSSLSGGERSFVTVAFLLALWDISDMPFHVLDEYDVFMDAENRNECMKMLMKKADQQPRTQFIFLSPLNVPFQDHSLIKIHRLADPEAINSTLSHNSGSEI